MIQEVSDHAPQSNASSFQPLASAKPLASAWLGSAFSGQRSVRGPQAVNVWDEPDFDAGAVGGHVDQSERPVGSREKADMGGLAAHEHDVAAPHTGHGHRYAMPAQHARQIVGTRLALVGAYILDPDIHRLRAAYRPLIAES